MKARLSIGRASSGCGKVIAINVEDELSGKVIAEVHVSYENFAQAITGLSGIPCEVDKLVSKEDFSKLGKEKVIEHAYCKKNYNKDVQRSIVMENFLHYHSEEWELLEDGTRSQQNGEQHRYTLVKWVGE